MPVISGTHYCTRCNHKLYWERFIPSALNTIESFTYTPKSHSVKLLNDPLSEILELRIECSECNQSDYFTYDTRNLRNKMK